jgi:signal transduction histidine kinase
MRSLQRRAILGGLLWAIAAVTVGGFALVFIFESVAIRRFDERLRDRHLQVLVALASSQSADQIETLLTDPAYGRAYSGRYWQIDGENQVATSPSMFDFQFGLPDSFPTEMHYWSGSGPQNPVRGVRERITLDDGSVWVVSVVESLEALNIERRALRRNVALAFGLVGLFMIFGAVTLTSVVVRPIRQLQQDIAHRWDEGRSLEVADYPSEVAPLVHDINALLQRNKEIIDSGRRQAADLAHALKTPSAVLRNELEHSTGDMSVPLEALDRIDAQIGRSLARIRAKNASKTVNLSTDVGEAATRLERLFRNIHRDESVDFSVRVEPSLTVPVDAQDLEEMLGNILENAFKWSRSTVRMSAEPMPDLAVITIEDDGPGIDDRQRETALAHGARLDTAVPGTGLGLAISQDLATAYGGEIQLGTSNDLNGLKVSILLPLRAAGMENPTTA